MNEPTRSLSIAGAWVVFVVASALPTTVMLVGSLTSPAGQWTLAPYRGVLSDLRQWQLLGTSLWVASGAAGVAALLGMPLGFALARGGLGRTGAWRLLLAAPLLIPPYVMAVAWTLGLGPTGPLASVISPDRLAFWTYSASGAALVLGASLFPLVSLGTEAALRRVNVRAEEAGRLVAPPTRVFRRITLPLIAPSIGATVLLVFALALTEFGVPGLLRVRVYTTEVFTAFSAFYDFSRATALAAPLLALVLVVMGVATRATGSMSLDTRRLTVPVRSGSRLTRRVAQALVATASAVTVALPIGLLAIDAWSGGHRITRASGAGPAIVASLALAVLAATVVTGVSAILGYARAHVHRRGWMIDLACAWLFAVPSTVVGVGLIRLWNRPVLDALYGTWAMLVLASVARFLPLGVLLVGAAARQITGSIEEAAVMSGATWPRRWTRIWLPQARWVVASVWSITFVLAFGELGASVRVIPPGTMTLPVHVYTMVANAPPGQLASLALVQAAVGVVGLVIAGRSWGRRPAC